MKYKTTVIPFIYETLGQLVRIPKLPHKVGGEIRCSCTLYCKQFLSYPVNTRGYKIIPSNAMCPYDNGRTCCGTGVLVNGEFVNHVPHYVSYKEVILEEENSKQR